MSVRLEPAFMLVNAPPFIQGNLVYPDLTQANQVAQAINSTQLFSQRVNVQNVRLPENSIPTREAVSAYMLIHTSPSPGLQVFYMDWSSCSSVENALKHGGVQVRDAHVRVTKQYVT